MIVLSVYPIIQQAGSRADKPVCDTEKENAASLDAKRR
jgi:hypothetical protein